VHSRISLQRLTTIVRALIRCGAKEVANELDRRRGRHWYHVLSARIKPQPLPEVVRESMEQLGGSFIKLGQLLSLRPDLVPIDYCHEFQKLQDHVPAMKPAELERLLVETYGKKLPFAFWDRTPLGSASIAQVHRATLHDGTFVVFKIRRPAIVEQLRADIDLMMAIAQRLDAHYGTDRYSFTTIIKEFQRYSERELEFNFEEQELEVFAKAFAKHPHIVVPRPFPALCKGNVLVMQFLDGKKVSQVKNTPLHIKSHFLAEHLVQAFTDMVFRLGVFHADMHPGNILILPGGKIGLLDFGIVGRISANQRSAGLELLLGLTERDTSMVCSALLAIGPPAPQTSLSSFRAHVRKILEQKEIASGKSRLTSTFHQLLDAAIQHGLEMPVDCVLLGKAAVTLEGTCSRIDPDFDFEQVLHDEVEQNVLWNEKEQVDPSHLVARLAKLRYTANDLGGTMKGILERIETGTLKLDIEHEDLKYLGDHVSTSSNRLAYSIIAGTFVIAGAMLVPIGPQLYVLSVGSWISFLISTFMVSVLLLSIVRE